MFEIFKIGFLSVTILDVVDIFLVTTIVYYLYKLLRGTIAAQIFIGLIFVLILSFLAQAANFKALGYLLKLITDIWVIAFIILFQPEIRRLLIMIGKNPIMKIFVKGDSFNVLDDIINAAFEMSQHQHGALVVFERNVGIRNVIDTGEPINANISKNLLKSIFFPRSPMHDGAVVVKGSIIEAARCTLPLSQKTEINGIQLGMRHRAGLGISEQTDAICLLVSEETGSISIAENGNMIHGLSREALRKKLSVLFTVTENKGFAGIWDAIKKKN